MPKRTDPQKILLSGSGPIVIRQACKALREQSPAVLSLQEYHARAAARPEALS